MNALWKDGGFGGVGSQRHEELEIGFKTGAVTRAGVVIGLIKDGKTAADAEAIVSGWEEDLAWAKIGETWVLG